MEKITEWFGEESNKKQDQKIVDQAVSKDQTRFMSSDSKFFAAQDREDMMAVHASFKLIDDAAAENLNLPIVEDILKSRSEKFGVDEILRALESLKSEIETLQQGVDSFREKIKQIHEVARNFRLRLASNDEDPKEIPEYMQFISEKNLYEVAIDTFHIKMKSLEDDLRDLDEEYKIITSTYGNLDTLDPSLN